MIREIWYPFHTSIKMALGYSPFTRALAGDLMSTVTDLHTSPTDLTMACMHDTS
jgi:hypothetical protein